MRASHTAAKEMRAQLALAGPLALGHAGHQFMSVVDTAMLGRYSDVALAGAGVANGLLWTVTLLGMGIVMGMDTLVPQAIGASEHSRARALLWSGVRMALRIALPLTLAAAAMPGFMLLMGVEPATRHEATLYVFGRLPAILPLLVYTALRSYLQAHSVTRPMVVAVVAGNAVNALGNLLLIYGDRGLVEAGLPAVGLPELGALGAAISTSIVTLVSMSICAYAVHRMHRAEPGQRQHGAVVQPAARDRALERSILRFGLPVGLQLFAEVGVFALVATLAGRLGTASAAAHQAAITVVSFAFNAVLGVGAATSVRVGLAVGTGSHRGARAAGLAGLALGIAVLGLAAVAFVAAPAAMAGLMTNQPTVIATAVPLFYIAATFQLADALQAVGAGALRGAGDTRSPMWAHLFGHYAVGAPVGVTLAFVFDMGAPGLWWGLAAGLTCAGAIVTVRFFQITGRPIARAE